MRSFHMSSQIFQATKTYGGTKDAEKHAVNRIFVTSMYERNLMSDLDSDLNMIGEYHINQDD